MSAFKPNKKKKGGEEPPSPRKVDPPKKHEGDEEGWLVSYADMMTLLCGFFIMMFSMAKMDEGKYEKVKESVAKQFGGEYRSPNQETAKYISQILQEMGLDKEMVVKSDPSGIAVAFESTLFFETLGSDIRSEGKAVLEKLIEAVTKRQDLELKRYKIVVEGHTDSRPIVSGVYPSNWELSSARASGVIRLFLDKGFSANHLTAIGYADTHPQMPERTLTGELDEKALAKNRRVVIRILEPKVDAIPMPETDKDLEVVTTGEPKR
jgi:chemotaxis protein MotB